MASRETGNLRLPKALQAEVEETARAQQRSPDALVQEAVKRYLRQQRREKLYAYGEAQARKLGIKESDVPDLITRTRRNFRSRQRSVTADSNIWVSAFNFRGKPRRLIEMADAGEGRIDISESIIGEVLRVLRDKFRWTPEKLREAASQMNGIVRKVTPTQAVEVVKEDPTDNRILECAAEGNSAYIVTGDKDLLRVGKFGNVPIVKVADFLEIQQGRGELEI